MVANRSEDDAIGHALRWPLRITFAGLVAERITRAFWPVWTILFAALAALAFGFQDYATVELFWLFCLAVPLCLALALYHGVRQFRWPRWDEARARLDATLPGRPLAALGDKQALGALDDQSRAVWRAHLERMRARLRGAKAPAPDLRLSGRDPFALRYAALVALIVAALFGSFWRVGQILQPANPALAGAPSASWEGWIEPPAHTGRPTLYLAKVDEGPLELPQGSRVILRLYGPPDSFEVRQDLSVTPSAAPAADAAPQMAFDFIVDHSGTLAIEGEGGRAWQVTVLADKPPSVALTGPMDRKVDGRMAQPFTAKDDFAITGGEVRFELDLPAVDRRFGLLAEPEPLPPLVFDLPLPMTGRRAEVSEILAEDASEHPWANLPVRMVLTVRDALGQTASTDSVALLLPGRRFFDPLAAGVIEMRRDLLWSRTNSERVEQILRAITHRPEGFVRSERAYLTLRVAIRRLTAARAQGPISVAVRDELAKALWEAALLIEDGGLADALERMKRAQDRLSEAMKNGASKDEIAKLMDELREATDDYLDMLAERSTEDPVDKFAKNQEGQPITDDQIAQMMDEIQRLMEEGRMAEAQELLEQLNQLMQNLKVTQGEGGEGRQSPGGKAMRDLGETLRNQQDLSDDAFRQGQNSQPGQNQPGQQGDEPMPGEGQEGQDQGSRDQGGQDQGGQGTEGLDGQSLADRQEALRRELERQTQALPDAQGQDADRARRALEDAGRAMDEAEEALRDGDLPGAIDRQAEAIGKLREGMRSLGEAFAQEQNRLTGADGQAQGEQGREMPLDPLGRDGGNPNGGPTNADNQNLLNGKDVYRRARDLLDEIRRRSSDRTRPEAELDYLNRLLDQF